MAAVLSPTRALGRTRRLDARAVFGVLLMLATVLVSLAFWVSSSDTRSVLVVTRDIAPGETLQRSDLAVAHVRVDDSIYSAAIPGDSIASAIGKPVNESLHAQQLLSRAQLSSRPPLAAGQMAMTIPVTSASAAGGRIQRGDVVEVLETLNKGKPESKSSVVLPRVTVYDVGYDERSTVVNTNPSGDPSRAAARPLSTLTLLVTPDQALQLSQAKWNGNLDVALLPPQP
ncbi:MAG: Flp pilus assembly protein CpaB [Chloroflexota bacterium]